MKEMKLEENKFDKPTQYPILGSNKSSLKTMIKMMLKVSTISKTIKREIIDYYSKKDEGKIENIFVGADVLTDIENDKKYSYFYINFLVPQFSGDNKEYYQYCIFAVDKYNPKSLIEIGSVDYLIDRNINEIYINNMSVKKEYRNHGVGSQLHKSIEDIAAKANIRILRLNSLSEAIKFHFDNGFDFVNFDDEILPSMIKKHVKRQDHNIKCPFEILKTKQDTELTNN